GNSIVSDTWKMFFNCGMVAAGLPGGFDDQRRAPADRAPAMSSGPVRTGIVGLGRLGRRHAENIARRVPGVELVAACSPVEEELRWAGAHLGAVACYRDYGELLRHPGLESVFLVTPTTLHATQITQGLAAGKHVFCEKPLSLDLADCERVSRA